METNTNPVQKPAAVFTEDGVEWIAKAFALEFLGIEDSTLFVACQRHDWLKDSIQRKVRHPVTGGLYTRMRWDAVLRYSQERRPGGGGSDHPGQFKVTTWLAEDEMAVASELLTKHFGREIVLGRAYAAKDKTDDKATEDKGKGKGKGKADKAAK